MQQTPQPAPIKEKTGATGPRTEAGKAISCQNALKHGLASGTLIIEGESREEFDALLNGFMFDHQPSNQTETALVHEFTKALWLKDRALRFQAVAFNINMPHLDNMAAPMDLPVLLRYQMAQERTFYRVLKILQDIAKQRKSQPQQFVSQITPELLSSEPKAQEFVSQNLNDMLKSAKIDPKKLPSIDNFNTQIEMMEAAMEESARTGEDPFAIEQRMKRKIA